MKFFYFLFIMLFVSLSSLAQVDESDFERFKREREEGLQRERERFEKFKEERDKDFAEFLLQEWKNFELFKSGEPVSFPGPETIPIYAVDIQPELPILKIPESQIKPIEAKPLKPIIIEPIPLPLVIEREEIKNTTPKSVNFYGTDLEFKINKNIIGIGINQVNENAISEFWSTISETEHYDLIEQLLEYKRSLYLNDFAFLMLIQNLSEKIMPEKNDSKLLTWFLLNKSGYNARIGYSNNNIHLLIPVINQLYGLPFYTFDNINFYVFDDNVSSIRTYDGDYPNASRIMDFNIYNTPLFAENIGTRELKFNYNHETYNFEFEYNLNHIDFYSDYPQGDIRIFFDAGMSITAQNSLIENFDSLLYEMDETFAADFLLRFTQTAFDYKTDDEQFGYEKYFFPEEVLHYPYSDCEDRSVLYAYLIKEFVQLPVIGLKFPGHIATAVRFNEKVDGAYFIFNNEKYLVCDPTYINAPIGAIMPDFVNSNVELLSLNNSGYQNMQNFAIWEKLNSKGIYRYSFENDIIKFDDNLFYVCGFIADTTILNNHLYTPTDSETMMVLLSTDKHGNIYDYNIIYTQGSGFIYGLNIIDNLIYLNGFYTENLSVGANTIESGSNKQAFISSFDLNLKNNWIKNTGVIHENPNLASYFQIISDSEGKIIQTKYINEISFEETIPVASYSNDFFIFSGNFEAQHLQLIESEIYTRKTPFEYASTVQNLRDYYISNYYNSDIAGLFAFLSTMQGGNIRVSGRELRATIAMIDPDFETKYPRLFRDLGDIRRIESRNNIITIYTSFLSNFKAGPIVINNRAKIRIRNFRSGNMQIYALSGINYRPFIRNYEINYIKLYRVTGDLLIDFGFEKNQRVINLKKRIFK